MIADKKCLYPKCDRFARVRGLCSPCHAQALVLVKEGKVTWEELAKARKISKPSTYFKTKGFRDWLLK